MFTRQTHWMLGDDASPDVYTVTRQDGDRLRVGHFVSYQATREHCHVVVRIRDEDGQATDATLRAIAASHGAETAALFRASALIDQKHASC